MHHALQQGQHDPDAGQFHNCSSDVTFSHWAQTRNVPTHWNYIISQEQYIFVYDGLLEALMSGDTSIQCPQLQEEFEKLQKVDPKTKKTKLQEQFEVFCREVCSTGPLYKPHFDFAGFRKQTEPKENSPSCVCATFTKVRKSFVAIGSSSFETSEARRKVDCLGTSKRRQEPRQGNCAK